jgi:hypothetical protein
MMPAGSSPVRQPVEFRVDAGRILLALFIVCVLVEIGFVVLDYQVNYAHGTEIGAVRRLFNITREDSLASWFAVTQTTLSALTLWGLVAIVRRQGGSGWRTFGWLVLALFFTWMAIDDGAKVHERMGTAFRTIMESTEERAVPPWGEHLLAFFPSYAWQLLFLPMFGGLGLFTLGFLAWELPDRSARLLVGAGLACFAIAVGLDFVEGLERSHPLNFYPLIIRWFDLYEFCQREFGKSGFEAALHFSKSIEEAIEMLGNTLLWIVFLDRLTTLTDDVRIRFLHPGESY